MEPLAARKAFNSGDLLLGNGFGSCDARPLGSSIDQDGAGATPALSAAVLGSYQIKMLAQYSEKADLRVRVDPAGTPVNSKVNRSHCDTPDCEPFRRT